MNFEKLDAIIESMKDEMLANLQKWISVPSVRGDAAENAPYGVELRRMLDMALADAKGFGFEVRDIDGYAGDITMGSGEKTLGMLSHLDVVPIGDGWTHNPWGGEIVGDRMYGRGAIDDKGPAICALYAMRAIKEAGIPLKDRVRLILGCDEESGMSDLEYYRAKCGTPEYGFSPDADFPVINTEKGRLLLRLSKYIEYDEGLRVLSITAGIRPNVVPAIAKAVVEVDDVEAFRADVAKVAAAKGFKLTADQVETNTVMLTAEGLQSHGAHPEDGKNAAGMMLIALKELGASPDIAYLADKMGMDYTGAGLGIAARDEISKALTCNMGILRYDGRYLYVDLDIRFPLCISLKEICASAVMAMSDGAFAVTSFGGVDPHHVPADSKIVRDLIKVYRDLTGEDAEPISIGGNTYCHGIPDFVAYGPNFPDTPDPCHVADEYLTLTKITLAVRIFAHAIVLLAGEQE